MPEFESLLKDAQAYISKNYAAVLSDENKAKQLRSYIAQYLIMKQIPNDNELIERIYNEMAEFSILTPYLKSRNYEEIDINAWNDIALIYRDGHTEKLSESFLSPQHAEDIIKRLLQQSGTVIDKASPIAQGSLPDNTRITAVKTPIVDKNVGISASLRILHPQTVTVSTLLDNGFLSEEMLSFLVLCMKGGVSFLISGETSSGKTTLLNCVLQQISNNERIFTIESGCRELSLVKETNGHILNNVIHTITHFSDNPDHCISQEKLVETAMRFNPKYLILGEIRDSEAAAALDAAMTGHTVLSTIHANPGYASHVRFAMLCAKKQKSDTSMLLSQVAMAFPVIVHTVLFPDNKRRVTDISEAVYTDGKYEYKILFRYRKGVFEKPNEVSESLNDKLRYFEQEETHNDSP